FCLHVRCRWRLRQWNISWRSGGAGHVYPFGSEVFQHFLADFLRRSSPLLGGLRFGLGFEQYSELLLRVEKGDQEKEDAEDEVGAERGHETRPPSDQVVVRELPGPQHERDDRPPEAGVQFKEVADRIANQFPDADEAAAGTLSAAGAVLSLKNGLAVQAELGRTGYPLVSISRPQYAPACLQLVLEPQGAVTA